MEDIELTLRLNEMLHFMEITLLDHVIVAGDDTVSLAQKGVLKLIPHMTFPGGEIRLMQEKIKKKMAKEE